jgi:hypothetical protein
MKLKIWLSSYFSKLYHESKIFRHFANYMGLSAGSTLILSVASTCPTCGVGEISMSFIGLVILGFILGLFLYVGIGIRSLYRKIKSGIKIR